MNTKNIYILEDRGIIFVNGIGTKDFLQNLITNDIYRVNEKNSCFASLLTPQGKFLFEFLIIKHKNGYFLDCEKKQVESLYKQLITYKLRSKVEIINLSNEFAVAAFSHQKFMSFEEAINIPGSTFKYKNDSILLDPRNTNLGGRLIINLEKLYLSLNEMNLNLGDTKEYYKFSYQLGIPQKNMDKLNNKLFGIECNFEELNGIDFKKGCYVGQENTARIKLKNKLSKRLLPLLLVKGTLDEGASILNNKNEIGKILLNDKDHSFGLIKNKNENFNYENEFTSNNATLKIIKPSWIKN